MILFYILFPQHLTHLKLRVALGLVDDEGVLFNEVGLLLLLGLPGLVLLLNLLDQPEGRVQVGAGGRQLARFLLVGAAEGPEIVEKMSNCRNIFLPPPAAKFSIGFRFPPETETLMEKAKCYSFA